MTEGGALDSAFWSIEPERLLQRLETTAEGLTQLEAEARLSRANRLRPRRQSPWSLLWDQFKSPIIVLLFCSAVLSYASTTRPTPASSSPF